MKIAIMGSSGFVGEELVKNLQALNFDVRLCSRSNPTNQPNWIMTDLFSRKLAENALEGVDVAFYLVHSMLPTSRLTQGRFQDQDLLLADNFLRSCKKNKVKQIIYLGGIIPSDKELSSHLKSRLEIEELFLNSEIPTTVFRAGLIIGDKGSSLNILKNCLLRSRVVLVYPELTNKLQAISLDDVVANLINSVNNKQFFKKVLTLGYKPLSYIDFIDLMAKRLGKKLIKIKLPFLPVRTFSLITSIVSKIPYALVYPLLKSTKHNLLADDFMEGSTEEALQSVALNPVVVHAASREVKKTTRARSVQRIDANVPPSYKIYRLYYNWIKKTFSPFMGVTIEGTRLSFWAFHKKISMLELEYNEDHSAPDRELLFVVGGLLASKNQDYGRLEFRRVKEGTIISALHDYIPALPWPVYLMTQALLHLWVMKSFETFLEKRFTLLRHHQRADS